MADLENCSRQKSFSPRSLKTSFMQGGMQKKLDSDLEELVVAPVAAAVNGLRRDTVFWQKGLLSSPPVLC